MVVLVRLGVSFVEGTGGGRGEGISCQFPPRTTAPIKGNRGAKGPYLTLAWVIPCCMGHPLLHGSSPAAWVIP